MREILASEQFDGMGVLKIKGLFGRLALG